jgi:signal transduction histidine kinase
MAVSLLQTARDALRDMVSEEGRSAEEKARLESLVQRMEKSLGLSVPSDPNRRCH